MANYSVTYFCTTPNHFALKYKLILKANIAAMSELKILQAIPMRA